MRAVFAILAILSLSTCCLAIQNKSLAKRSDDLHYYHKYEANHSWTPNVHVPLQQHYSNERNLRKELYKTEDQMQKLKHDHEFHKSDVKRAELAKKNELVKLETTTAADSELREERAAAIKEEINHDEKFREKYHARFLKNKDKLVHAMPDQEAALGTLTDFDKSRDEHFQKHEMSQNEKLQKEEKAIVEENMKAETEKTHLKSEIHKLHTEEGLGEAGYAFKMTALGGKVAELQAEVSADAHLDVTRRQKEELEAKATNVAQKN